MDPQLESLLPTAFRASYLIGNLTKHAQSIDGEAISKELTTSSEHHTIAKVMFPRQLPDSHAFHMYALLRDGTLMVACRETAGFGDWMSNLKISADISLEGRIHSGFWKKATSIPLYPLLEHLRTGKRVVFTGFSQGSAVAELIMVRLINHIGFDMKWALQRRVLFIGFGSPLIGDEAFCQSIRSATSPDNIPLYRSLFYHVVNKGDVVPRLTSALRFVSGPVESLMNSLLGFVADSTARKVLGEVSQEAFKLLVPEYKPHGVWLFSETVDDKTSWTILDTAVSAQRTRAIERLTYSPRTDAIKLEHFQQHRPSGYMQSLHSLCNKSTLPAQQVSCALVFNDKPKTTARWMSGYYYVLVSGAVALHASQLYIQGYTSDQTTVTKNPDLGELVVLKVECAHPTNKLVVVIELPYFLPNNTTKLEIPCECEIAQDLADINRMPLIAILRCALFHALLAPQSSAGRLAIQCLTNLEAIYDLSGNEDAVNSLNKEDMTISACLVAWLLQTGEKLETDRVWENPQELLQPKSLTKAAKYLFSLLGATSNNETEDHNRLKRFIDNRRQGTLNFAPFFRRLDQQFQEELNSIQLPPMIPHQMLFSRFTAKNVESNPSITAFFSAAAPVQNLIMMKLIHSPKLSLVKTNYYTTFKEKVKRFFALPLRLFNVDLYPDRSLVKADKSYVKRLVALYTVLFPNHAANLNLTGETLDLFSLEQAIDSLTLGKVRERLNVAFEEFAEKHLEIRNCANFYKVVKNVFRLRSICKSERFIAVAGMQNAGKSRVLNELWGMQTGSTITRNTREPSAYQFEVEKQFVANIKAIDLPAITDSNVLNSAMQTMILPCTLAACIVLDIKNAQDVVCLDWLRDMECQMKFPFIVLLNQADVLLKNILEEPVSTANDPWAAEEDTDADKNENRTSVFKSRVNQIIFEIISRVPSLVGRIYPTCFFPQGRRELAQHGFMSKFDNENTPLAQPPLENELVVYGRWGVRYLLDYHFRGPAIRHLNEVEWAKLIVGPKVEQYCKYHALYQ